MTKRLRKRTPFLANSRGQAALEFAITLPLIVFLLICTVDMGMMMNQYLKLTHISYEGARHAASLAGLSGKDENGLASETAEKKILEIKNRVLTLVKSSGFTQDAISIDVTYIPLNSASDISLPDGVSTEDVGNSVMITTQVAFRGYFPLFDGLPISATATAPYLFKDEEVGG